MSMNGVQQATATNPTAKANGLEGIGISEYKGNSAKTATTQAKADAPASEKSGGTMADIAKMFSEAISQIVTAFVSAVTAMAGGKGAEASANAKPAGESMKTEAATEKKAEATASDAKQKSGDTSLLASMFSGLLSSFDKVATAAADKTLKSV